MTTRFVSTTRLRAALSICALSASIAPAHAAFEVTSPYVEEGIMELEWKSRMDFDDRASEDDYRENKLEVKYGINNWLALAVEGEVEKERGDNTTYSATELEAYLQFSEPGEYWLDSGAKLEYEFAHHARSADKVEAILLLEKETGRLVHTANVKLEREVGEFSNDETEGGLGWRTRYLWKPWLEPGFEWHSDLGELSDMGSWSEQKHRVGPAVYGKLGYGFAYETGYFFGVSRAAEDASAKFILEYEFPL